ncbi:DNA/RNA nuclease SfsA [Acuticoccus mangrovi]|uniref:Sugar fermentation stimulation protein homolog n=1 Tax=Acuticoccus mangrovi TaxID=2796142 RepID=A0A934IFG8_9HYPH|nr:DNA/RNA nuclease SfsA [Acuticoccus mangrovi]MBJ3775533.1 DNA/RNA nuclease SfsA [Acuticoccus mangrovi]
MITHSFGPLIEATWVERRKRFMLDVVLPDGSAVTAHCPNTGAMTGIGGAGHRVLLSVSDNPKRRYAHTLEAVDCGGVWVGVNTQNPNRIAAAMARAGLPPFPATGEVRPEVRYGRAERIDLLVTAEDGGRTYVEIKNVHLVERPGEASFPDCVTARGAKHLDALADVVRAGDRALMVFLIQRHDVDHFRLARHIDPAYGAAFDRAVAAGVEMAALRCRLDGDGITADGLIPIMDLPTAASAAA